MKRLLRRQILTCIPFVLFASLYPFCKKQTDGFAVSKIISTLPLDHSFAPAPLANEEMKLFQKIFSEPFYYLGKGAQCFAFSSCDDQYVIKFFRFDHLEPGILYTKGPLPSFLQEKKKNKIDRSKKKINQTFLSYQFAYDHIKQETGLVYLHLQPTDNLNTNITFFDKIGVKHSLSLDNIPFLIQKKAEPFYPTIKHMIASGQQENVKDLISKLIRYLKDRSCHGMYDKDPAIIRNFGILHGNILQIDVGRFLYDPSRRQSQVYIDDIKRATDRFNIWLLSVDPDLSLHLQREINSL
jgi:hypothetical protein